MNAKETLDLLLRKEVKSLGKQWRISVKSRLKDEIKYKADLKLCNQACSVGKSRKHTAKAPILKATPCAKNRNLENHRMVWTPHRSNPELKGTFKLRPQRLELRQPKHWKDQHVQPRSMGMFTLENMDIETQRRKLIPSTRKAGGNYSGAAVYLRAR